MSSPTILIVEDEWRMRVLLRDYLENDGYTVLEAKSGDEAISVFAAQPVQLVLLDIMMPGLDGYSVCEEIRKGSDVLILMLTARSEEDDKLLGYELGADDYVTKPFSPKVLMAKIRNLLKRAQAGWTPEHAGNTRASLCHEGIAVIEAANEVYVDEEETELSPKEYELLVYFMKNPNITLNRDRILDAVWGFDYDGDYRTVDTHIKRLRQKLRHRAHVIATIRGIGYQFRVKR